MAEDNKGVCSIGLDVGTMNILSARRGAKGIEIRRMRDAYLSLPPNAKKMLKLSGQSFVERDDDVVILGDAALETANIFGKEPKRPLAAGMVASGDPESMEVLALLLKNVLGEPKVAGEVCYYSVPAEPIDCPDKDIIYHKGILGKIIKECGYTPYSSNEAMGIIYSETAKEGFSGLALSWGSGMVNVALAINTIEGLSFSLSRSGDWIDKGVAQSIGSTQARICAIKEQGVDLLAPKDRTQEAIAFYYRSLIDYTLDKFVEKFKTIEGKFALTKPIPLIVSGGTSMAGNFVEIFKQQFNNVQKKFPVQISEIRHANEPLNAVAYGMLVQALQEHEE
jgi:hypothetical protein